MISEALSYSRFDIVKNSKIYRGNIQDQKYITQILDIFLNVISLRPNILTVVSIAPLVFNVCLNNGDTFYSFLWFINIASNVNGTVTIALTMYRALREFTSR